MTEKPAQAVVTTLACTVLALVAFAANSVLCRLALGADTIDASGFTVIRLLSGALVLFLVMQLRKTYSRDVHGSWLASSMLFIYAITFSFAYITLDTGTGALILFGSVQITMILLSLFGGNRLHRLEWLGVTLAFSGFVYLVLPGVSAPSITGFILMTTAGIAWGIYTLRGRGSRDALADTGYNFIRTVPAALALAVLGLQYAHYTIEGVMLAVMSGAIASGIGYTIWYIALGGLPATQAAVVQLSVPVIAAFGGVIFVSEAITLRLTLATVMILGGILLVVLRRYYYSDARQQ